LLAKVDSHENLQNDRAKLPGCKRSRVLERLHPGGMRAW
jgi:hypothetical protein